MSEIAMPALDIPVNPTMNQVEQTISELGEDLVYVAREYDRRVNHRRAAFYSLFKKRRRTGSRRDDEATGHSYVDLHERPLFFLAVIACMLSVCDAFFTMRLIEHGSQELNPMLDYFLAIDERLFFAVKFAISTFCIFFLVMHKNYLLLNRISGMNILVASIFGYSILIMYEFTMLVAIYAQ